MPKTYKEGRKANTITQKPMSLKVDCDLLDWLGRMPNRSRYINDLIRKDMTCKKIVKNTKCYTKILP